MAAEIDGPRLAPRSGSARQLVVFLHGYGADGNDLIEIGRAWQPLLPQAAFVSPHAPEPCGQAPTGRQWFPLTFRDPNERWIGVNKAAPMLERFLDAELARHGLPASALALVGFSQGTMMALHVGLRRATPPAGDRRLFRPARPSGAGRHRGDRADDHVAAAGAPGARRQRRPHPAASAVSVGARPRGAWRSRSNGISPPASATASTAKVCVTAANFWRAALPASAERTLPTLPRRLPGHPRLTHNPRDRLHNPVTPPYKLGAIAALRQLS